MRFLTLAEVLALHRQVVEQTRGSQAVRDLAGLTSAVAQPRMTFEGRDLYPRIEEKAAALCFSLILNHPFVDVEQACWPRRYGNLPRSERV